MQAQLTMRHTDVLKKEVVALGAEARSAAVNRKTATAARAITAIPTVFIFFNKAFLSIAIFLGNYLSVRPTFLYTFLKVL